MVLILPEAHSNPYCPRGAASSGFLASIRAALQTSCGADADGVSIRILGSYVILEGLVPSDECVARLREVAEDIAGTGYVRLRLFRQ